MKYAVLAVLLTIVQAAPPVPRKTPNNSAHAASNIKKKSTANQAPAQAAPIPNKTDGNGPTESDSGKQRSDNEGNSVVIRQLPAVTVNGPRRDWADWGSWVFNLLLVGVGVAGIIIAVCTLKNIARQTHLLVVYTAATRRGVRAAKASAEAALLNAKALKSAERAHIDIDFVPTKDGSSLYHFKATNFGKSHAIISSYTFTRYRFLAKPNNQMPDKLTIENGVGKAQESYAVNQMLPVGPTVTVFEFDISHYLSAEQRGGREWAMFGGSITYEDIFTDEHTTEAVYSYRILTSSLKNEPRYNRYTSG